MRCLEYRDMNIKDFNPKELNFDKKLSKEESDLLGEYINAMTMEGLVKNFELGNRLNLTEEKIKDMDKLGSILCSIAEHHNLDPHELIFMVQHILYDIVRKYVITQVEYNRQSFQQEMK